MKKKEIIKNAFYLLNEVINLKYELDLEKLENKKLSKQLSIHNNVFDGEHLSCEKCNGRELHVFGNTVKCQVESCKNIRIRN
jgi:hypothetical protein